jgi:hypothetical protein
VTAVVRADRPAADGDAAGTVDTDAYARATRLIASAAVVLVGSDLHVAYGATAALAAAVLLFPLWLPVLREHAFATLITGLAALAAVAGLILSELSSVDHEISATQRVQAIGLLGSGIAAFGLILWARSAMPLPQIAILYGAGALASAVAHGHLDWTHNLAVPTTFVVLGILERRRAGVVPSTGAVPAMAVLTLGVVGIAQEARGYFGVCVLAAVLTLWQLRPGGPAPRMRARDRWFPLALVAGLGFAAFLLVGTLATGGFPGDAEQRRPAADLEATGSSPAGGRPEWAATRELVELRPGGFGAGVVPNWADRTAGETGLASIDVDAGGNGDDYMFGSTFELHSVSADLWARFGWVGVAVAGTIVLALIRSLLVLVGARQAPTFLSFACVLALWYVLSGPMDGNWLDVCAALGMALVPAGATFTRRRAAEPPAA